MLEVFPRFGPGPCACMPIYVGCWPVTGRLPPLPPAPARRTVPGLRSRRGLDYSRPMGGSRFPDACGARRDLLWTNMHRDERLRRGGPSVSSLLRTKADTANRKTRKQCGKGASPPLGHTMFRLHSTYIQPGQGSSPTGCLPALISQNSAPFIHGDTTCVATYEHRVHHWRKHWSGDTAGCRGRSRDLDSSPGLDSRGSGLACRRSSALHLTGVAFSQRN